MLRKAAHLLPAISGTDDAKFFHQVQFLLTSDNGTLWFLGLFFEKPL